MIIVPRAEFSLNGVSPFPYSSCFSCSTNTCSLNFLAQPTPPLAYCSGYNDWPGACCTAGNELTTTKNVVDTIITSSTNANCYHHIKEIYCAFCSPLAAHKFNVESGGESGLGRSPTLCPQFCQRYASADRPCSI